MKILVDSNIPYGKDLFLPYGRVTLFEGRHLKNTDISDASALIIRSITEINESLVKNSSLEFVGSCTIGTDHVDLNCLNDLGIQFACAPGCNSNAVGDYIISALSLLGSKFKIDYRDKTLGIIGYGNVGRNLGKKAKALGLKVLANDPPLYDMGRDRDNLSDLSRVMDEADILSFHVPLTKSGQYKTEKMFNENFLKKLKKPVMVLNSSRGDVMDEQTLISGKIKGDIKHIVLDVFPGEPLISSELAGACDIMTPHIAGYSIEGKMKGSLQVLDSFIDFFKLPDRIHEDWMTPPQNSIPWKGQQDEKFLLQLFEKACPFTKLDKDLRSAITSKNPAGEFDRLRKELTDRQDFTSFRVKGIPRENSPLVPVLKELGFKLDVLTQTEAIT